VQDYLFTFCYRRYEIEGVTDAKPKRINTPIIT
jgi:hypothetical protein